MVHGVESIVHIGEVNICMLLLLVHVKEPFYSLLLLT